MTTSEVSAGRDRHLNLRQVMFLLRGHLRYLHFDCFHFQMLVVRVTRIEGQLFCRSFKIQCEDALVRLCIGGTNLREIFINLLQFIPKI
jgi:hypothetical protein